jgi:hypothetical protein
MPITELKPIKATFVRDVDGYRVPLTRGGRVIPLAEGYEIGAGFTLQKPVVDREKVFLMNRLSLSARARI